MHVSVRGIAPDSFAVPSIETAAVSFHRFVIEHLEHGLRGPLVLEDYCAGEKRVVLEVEKNAEVV